MEAMNIIEMAEVIKIKVLTSEQAERILEEIIFQETGEKTCVIVECMEICHDIINRIMSNPKERGYLKVSKEDAIKLITSYIKLDENASTIYQSPYYYWTIDITYSENYIEDLTSNLYNKANLYK